MFPRRSHQETAVSPVEVAVDGSTRLAAQVGKKGRPTPSRKEAEAAAAARAKVPRTRKEQVAAARAQRYGGGPGGSKELPRDQGPVRKLVRDLVDARLGFAQLTFPLMLIAVVLNALPSSSLRTIGGTLQLGVVILVVLDLVWVRFRVRREVRRRFPDAPLTGLTWYAVSRSIYPKFARRGLGMPRPTVKIGEQLPQTYR